MRLGVFAATLGAFASSAAAEESLELDYEVYFGGMHILSAQARLQTDGDDRYRVASTARTRGWVDWMFGFKGESTTVGAVKGVAAKPARHERVSTWDEGERTVTLTYLDDGRVKFDIEETREELATERERLRARYDTEADAAAAQVRVQSPRAAEGLAAAMLAAVLPREP